MSFKETISALYNSSMPGVATGEWESLGEEAEDVGNELVLSLLTIEIGLVLKFV